MRVMYLRQTFGPTARIVMIKIDVDQAFRQVAVDAAGVANFGYAIDEVVVVDLRVQFGWRNSPGYWGLVTHALEHSHNHTTFKG